MFIFAIILIIAAIVLLGAGLFFNSARKKEEVRVNEHNANRRPDSYTPLRDNEVMSGFWFLVASAVSAAAGIILLIVSMTFTVDTGSSVVLKDWTGVAQEDEVTTAGIHTKSPWQDTIAWDIKNQDATFTGDGTTTHNGQQVSGAEITVIDKDGISANLDIQVLFSIKADKVVDLTKGYTNQDDFEIKVVENDVKSVPRDVASMYTTVQMFEDRSGLKADITEALEKSWADKGVIVDNVNIHGIRYPEDVQQRFKDAQNAQTDLLKAETDAQTAKTTAEGEAQAEIAKANGEAEANRILSQSLTPQVLQQRWIDAIKGSGTIIVPQDFTSLGNLTPQG
jgi:regulator of protease activity HflC (stomatin/prohibitin superfamily)